MSKQAAWEAHTRWIDAQSDAHRATGHEGLDPAEVAPARAGWQARRTTNRTRASRPAGPSRTGYLTAKVSAMTERRVRIGIDTGGTFTDVVAVDEETGQTTTTKTPSTPADPAEGFLNGVRKVLGLMDLDGSAVTAVSHGTTVATNQLLEGKLDRIGFITTEGYESVLEIARQSVPDGYGNSYFWVKPPRIVPADLVRTVGGRLDHTGTEVRPVRRRRRPRGRPLLQGRRDHHDRRLLPARLRERRPRAADARGDPGGAPRRRRRASRARCCASTASTSAR